MGGGRHLVRRFFSSLRPGGPSRSDKAWVIDLLSEAQLGLWLRMTGPDRRHSVAVGRGTERRLGDEATAAVLAAALLHDVGKIEAGLRTWGRVVATLSAGLVGHDTARLWVSSRGFTRRVGLYLSHPEIGADMLEMAGSDPLVVAWADQHHRDLADCTIDLAIAEVLAAIDDD